MSVLRRSNPDVRTWVLLVNRKVSLRIKAVEGSDELLIDVLAIPYGGPDNGRDSDDQYFDSRTELHPDKFPSPPLVYYHGFTPDGREAQKPIYLGEPIKRWKDSAGEWIRYKLDKAMKLSHDAMQWVRDGVAFVSSGTAPHLARSSEATGHIQEWPIVEVSIIDAEGDRQPANRYAVTKLVAQKAYKAAGLAYPDASNKETESKQSIEALPKENAKEGANPKKTQAKGKYKAVDILEQILAMLQEYIASMAGDVEEIKAEDEDEDVDKEALEEAVKSLNETVKALVLKDVGADNVTPETLQAFVKSFIDKRDDDFRTQLASDLEKFSGSRKAKMKAAMDKARLKAAINEPGVSKAGGGVHMPSGVKAEDVSAGEDYRYAGRSAADMAAGYLFAKAAGKEALHITPDYLRALAGKAKDYADNPALKGKDQAHAIKAMVRNIKADEFDASNIAGQGQEWVAPFWSTDIWEQARDTEVIEQVISKGMHVHELPQGHGSMTIPTEGSDPIVYSSPEANDNDATDRPEVTAPPQFIGTGNVVVTPGLLKAAVGATRLLSEKSIIDVGMQFSAQLTKKMSETITQLFLNGDTETAANTNINLIDGTPGTTTARPYYLASDGALKYALITGTSTSRDVTTYDIDDPNETLKLLPSAVNAELDNLLFLMDASTRFSTLGLAELKTVDVAGAFATVQSGRILNLWGVDTISTGFMPKANLSGLVPAAGGTLGRLLAVYAPYWAMVWARHIDLEVGRDALSGTDIFVASARVGFKARGAGASAVSYNIVV